MTRKCCIYICVHRPRRNGSVFRTSFCTLENNWRALIYMYIIVVPAVYYKYTRGCKLRFARELLLSLVPGARATMNIHIARVREREENTRSGPIIILSPVMILWSKRTEREYERSLRRVGCIVSWRLLANFNKADKNVGARSKGKLIHLTRCIGILK